MNTNATSIGPGEDDELMFDFESEFPGDDQFTFEMEDDEGMGVLFEFEG